MFKVIISYSLFLLFFLPNNTRLDGIIIQVDSHAAGDLVLLLGVLVLAFVGTAIFKAFKK